MGRHGATRRSEEANSQPNTHKTTGDETGYNTCVFQLEKDRRRKVLIPLLGNFNPGFGSPCSMICDVAYEVQTCLLSPSHHR
jgi:hypothetical protein